MHLLTREGAVALPVYMGQRDDGNRGEIKWEQGPPNLEHFLPLPPPKHIGVPTPLHAGNLPIMCASQDWWGSPSNLMING